jgi:hypothetical protein
MPQTFERIQVGKRESLSDVIAVVDAKSTPIITSIKKGSDPANSLFSWQADAYAAPQVGGVPDGSDVSTTEDAAENRRLLSNYTEEFRRLPKVSKRSNLSDVAGIGLKKEMAKAIIKKQIELKRDMEAAFSSDNVARADDGTLGYRGHGLGSWISNTAQTTLPVDVLFRTPSTSINSTAMASLTTAAVNNVMESQFREVGKETTYMLVCGTALKKQFTTMVGYQPAQGSDTAIKRSLRGDEGKWLDNIQIFTGDFGTYELVLSTFLAWNYATGANVPQRGYALDMDMLELRYQQPVKYDPLPDLGGGPRGVLSAIVGLCVKNPRGLAAFRATS